VLLVALVGTTIAPSPPPPCRGPAGGAISPTPALSRTGSLSTSDPSRAGCLPSRCSTPRCWHRGWRDARPFHSSFAAVVALAAGIVLLPNLPLGTLTTLVQALAGILLPSTVVLLLILCNDQHLLGPLTNGRWLNAAAISAVAVVLGLSTVLTISTVLPGADIVTVAVVTAGLLAAGIAALATTHLRRRAATPPTP
jgi:Natural resistance-associated macrophage protein-like